MKKHQEDKTSDLERTYNGRHNIYVTTLSACRLRLGVRQAELMRAGFPEFLGLLSGPKEAYLNLEIQVRGQSIFIR